MLQIEAAKRAGVSVRTIQRAIQRGDLAAQHQGRKCWIRIDDLDRWHATHATPGVLSHTTVHDSDVLQLTRRDVPHDASRHVTVEAENAAGEIARLRKEVDDARLERDRWHEAFLRESEHRAEETRQLRQLLQQEQALSFSRVQALEATTRHDPTSHDASVEEPQDAAIMETRDEETPVAAPGGDRPWWRRIFGS